jgi:hypothetical protein
MCSKLQLWVLGELKANGSCRVRLVASERKGPTLTVHLVCIYSPGVQSPTRRDYQFDDLLVANRGGLQPFAV